MICKLHFYMVVVAEMLIHWFGTNHKSVVKKVVTAWREKKPSAQSLSPIYCQSILEFSYQLLSANIQWTSWQTIFWALTSELFSWKFRNTLEDLKWHLMSREVKERVLLWLVRRGANAFYWYCCLSQWVYIQFHKLMSPLCIINLQFRDDFKTWSPT